MTNGTHPKRNSVFRKSRHNGSLFQTRCPKGNQIAFLDGKLLQPPRRAGHAGRPIPRAWAPSLHMSFCGAFLASDYLANKPTWGPPPGSPRPASLGPWLSGPWLHFHTASLLCDMEKCHYLPRKQGLKWQLLGRSPGGPKVLLSAARPDKLGDVAKLWPEQRRACAPRHVVIHAQVRKSSTYSMKHTPLQRNMKREGPIHVAELPFSLQPPRAGLRASRLDWMAYCPLPQATIWVQPRPMAPRGGKLEAGGPLPLLQRFLNKEAVTPQFTPTRGCVRLVWFS